MITPNEDSLMDAYDHMRTHTDPYSPFYDVTHCAHGVSFENGCEECEEEFLETQRNEAQTVAKLMDDHTGRKWQKAGL
jgi:hypothetical protein